MSEDPTQRAVGDAASRNSTHLSAPVVFLEAYFTVPAGNDEEKRSDDEESPAPHAAVLARSEASRIMWSRRLPALKRKWFTAALEWTGRTDGTAPSSVVSLARRGIPPPFRGPVWYRMLGNAEGVTPAVFAACLARAFLAARSDKSGGAMGLVVQRMRDLSDDEISCGSDDIEGDSATAVSTAVTSALERAEHTQRNRFWHQTRSDERVAVDLAAFLPSSVPLAASQTDVRPPATSTASEATSQQLLPRGTAAPTTLTVPRGSHVPLFGIDNDSGGDDEVEERKYNVRSPMDSDDDEADNAPLRAATASALLVARRTAMDRRGGNTLVVDADVDAVDFNLESRAMSRRYPPTEPAPDAAAIAAAAARADRGGTTEHAALVARLLALERPPYVRPAVSSPSRATESRVTGNATASMPTAVPAPLASPAATRLLEVAGMVDADLSRTFPRLAFFSPGAPGRSTLRRVLLAYAAYRPEHGYLQGMSHLAAMLTLVVGAAAESAVDDMGPIDMPVSNRPRPVVIRGSASPPSSVEMPGQASTGDRDRGAEAASSARQVASTVSTLRGVENVGDGVYVPRSAGRGRGNIEIAERLAAARRMRRAAAALLPPGVEPDYVVFESLVNLLSAPPLRWLVERDDARLDAWIRVYTDALRRCAPRVSAALEGADVDPRLYLLSWLLTLFAKPLGGPDSAASLWDRLLCGARHSRSAEVLRAAVGLTVLLEPWLVDSPHARAPLTTGRLRRGDLDEPFVLSLERAVSVLTILPPEVCSEFAAADAADAVTLSSKEIAALDALEARN